MTSHAVVGRGSLPASLLPAFVPDGAVHSCLLTLSESPGLGFDISQFAAAGLALPDQIARSVPRRQAEFFHGRWAAREVLRPLLGRDVDVPIGASREPVWPVGIVGSITHCDGFAAAVAARSTTVRALGIDIERVAEGESLHALRTTTLDEGELRLLHAQEGEREGELDSAMLTTLAFSAKESLFKAAFPTVGRYFDFDAARVVELDLAAQRLSLRMTDTLSPAFLVGSEVTVRFSLIRPEVVVTSLYW